MSTAPPYYVIKAGPASAVVVLAGRPGAALPAWPTAPGKYALTVTVVSAGVGSLAWEAAGTSPPVPPPPPVTSAGTPLGLLLALTKAAGGTSPPPVPPVPPPPVTAGSPLGLLLALTH